MLAVVGVVFSAVHTPHPTIRVYEGGNRRGSVIHVMDARSGHEAKYLRGWGADHVLIDEAAFVPESLITEVAMPMLATTDGRMTLISTPRGRNHFYRFFLMGVRGEKGFWSRQSPSWENPLVSREYLRLQREILTERAFRTEYGAEFLDSVSSVFSSEALDQALRAPEVSSGAVVLGVDWARYRDYTALACVCGTRQRAEVKWVRQWSGARWLESVHRVAELAVEAKASRVVCDTTGVGDAVTEELRGLIPSIAVEGFVFTRRSKVELVEGLAWLLEHGRLRLPSDTSLLRQLEHFEAMQDERGVRYAGGSGFGDDLVCALALACWGLSSPSPLTILSLPRV
jgi:phage FluMu gp28-like protein